MFSRVIRTTRNQFRLRGGKRRRRRMRRRRRSRRGSRRGRGNLVGI